MGMADDYIASLGDSKHLLTRSGKLDTKGRWLAHSFIRNGIDASLDIAVGPNPSVNMLDLLVMTSLQRRSFEDHWIPAGIGEAGMPALARLKRAEADAWAAARKVLSEEQLHTVRELIAAWIAENPDRTVVALVRFHDFADERKISSVSLRGQAHGLLSEVSEASAAVDDMRFLGERLLWFAGRYPYLLGEQTELTAYRLIDQPEVSQLIETNKSAQRLGDALAKRIETFEGDLEEQQQRLFAQLSAERTAAIVQLQTALDATARKSIEQADKSFGDQRNKAINQLFDGIAKERALFLNDISSRQNELIGIMAELRQTLTVSGSTAKEVTATAQAVDKMMSRFERDPDSTAEPFRMTDVRDAAVETGNAADRMTRLLERANQLLDSRSLDRTLATINHPADEVIDRVFWRGVILISLLVAGIGLLRFVPQRIVEKRDAA
ncbi:MAG: hypothetical protein ED859_10390 [Desulfuromonadales bacterium]|nr:MAG: hypothetical protein ED859_10390 [Desulfuromonadales bacterium]